MSMNAQQAAQSRSANGHGRRRVDRDISSRMETKTHTGKSVSGSFGNSGLLNGGKVGGLEGSTRDRLIYITTCLVGHYVEAHVKNGSIISGIFHAANVEKDFGIVLKMARIIKDGSVKGPNLIPETLKKPQTMIILARELVQVIAKDVPLGMDLSVNGDSREKRQDLMIDSAISHLHHMETERELQPWVPDEDDPGCPELENIFDGTWNRNWDQFETNKTLFGVKSTFDEELYTTKLERGPQTKELEREALRIAREIEGEETGDFHLAEERGFHFHDDLGLDEETRFSAVRREVNDGRFEEDEDTALDSHNEETFGGTSSSLGSRLYADGSRKKIVDDNQASTVCSSMGDESDHVSSDDKELQLGSNDHVSQLELDFAASERQNLDDDKRLDMCQTKSVSEDKDSTDCTARTFESMQASISEAPEVQTAISTKDLSPTAGAYSHQESKHHISDLSECSEVSTASEAANSCRQPGGTTSTSERLAGSATSGRGISPSSSVGSLSSEKSTLNPNAKEFKLNPNAKSFTPSSPLRPHAPTADGAFYYASNIAAVPDMHGMPMGIGIGPAFGGHQPVVYNPQIGHMPTQPAYMHPGPLYGQHVINGQPRPGFYVPAYPNEMMYKGRNF